MIYVFNIVVIGLIALIAYWWANQGLFSAVLHLLCVVVAGAVAFGVWEPLVVGFLLRGSWFDHYAWGVTLIGVFAVTLFLLRLATDKLAPANVDLPRWANLGFGFPVGGMSGVITLGIVLIGCGFLQSTSVVMGYRGYGRSGNSGEVVKYSGSLWVPAHYWTSELYGWLSVTSMWTPRPMQRYYPQLHWQAAVIRDSYQDGKGQITMPPDAASIRDHYFGPEAGRAAVTVHFDAGAMDYGEQLTLSNAQVRLIGDARGTSKPDVLHPDGWVQDGIHYLFDNRSHYIVSTPGRESADATILFKVPSGFVPRFIQIKGVRYELPAPKALPPGLTTGEFDGGGASAGAVDVDLSARPIPDEDIKVSNSIRPVRISANMLRGSMEEQDRYLVEGFGSFALGGMRVARNLMIRGIFEPPGTRIVMLDVSRDKVCDLFDKGLRSQVAESAHLALVDSDGNTYSPIGYIHRRGGGGKTDIKLVPGKFIRTLGELPYLPTSRTEELQLYFRVTEKVTIVGFTVGDLTVGTANLEVPVNV